MRIDNDELHILQREMIHVFHINIYHNNTNKHKKKIFLSAID